MVSMVKKMDGKQERDYFKLGTVLDRMGLSLAAPEFLRVK